MAHGLAAMNGPRVAPSRSGSQGAASGAGGRPGASRRVPPCSRVKRASDATSPLVNGAGLISVVIRATVP